MPIINIYPNEGECDYQSEKMLKLNLKLHSNYDSKTHLSSIFQCLNLFDSVS